jgi:predicted PolB exonuclease-like 3'-5' exonuclease
MKIKSIKWKIVLWFVSISVLGLTFLTLFIYMGISDTVEEMVDNNSGEIIEGRAAQISEWIGKNLKAVEIMANSETVISLDFEKIPDYLNKRKDAMGKNFTTTLVFKQ